MFVCVFKMCYVYSLSLLSVVCFYNTSWNHSLKRVVGLFPTVEAPNLCTEIFDLQSRNSIALILFNTIHHSLPCIMKQQKLIYKKCTPLHLIICHNSQNSEEQLLIFGIIPFDGCFCANAYFK